MVELADGTLFVAGYDDPAIRPNLWRSRDHGANSQRVDVGTKKDGAVRNSDVEIAVGPKDELFFVTMGFDLRLMAGTHVAVGVSKDEGATWHWKILPKHHSGSRIHGQGGASHRAVGPLGELAVRITPSSLSGSKFTEGVDLIAVQFKRWQDVAEVCGSRAAGLERRRRQGNTPLGRAARV